MKCKSCRALIDRLCHSELTSEESAALESHIKECDACRRDLAAAMNITREDLGLVPPELPADFTQSVMKQIAGTALRKAGPRRSRASQIKWAATAACLIIGVVAAILFVGSQRNSLFEDTGLLDARHLSKAESVDDSDNWYGDIHANDALRHRNRIPGAGARFYNPVTAGNEGPQDYTESGGMSENTFLGRFRDNSTGTLTAWSWDYNEDGKVLELEKLRRLRELGVDEIQELCKSGVPFQDLVRFPDKDKWIDLVCKRQTGVAPEVGTAAAGKDKPLAKPKTWKRYKAPTFARVYVGGGNSLELVRMQVNVTVEGPRARTLVDHIFYNPHDKQLEGTFEYPLPAGASPCYYAMFIGQQATEAPVFFRQSEIPENLPELSPQEIVAHVEKKYWGELHEARIVKKETARVAYEEIVRRKIDPALLEYAGANTFRGRVFPIPAKGYNRVIIAYEQTLENTGDAMQYRFPLPDCEMKSLNFALTALSDDCKNPSLNTKDITGAAGKGRLLYAGEWSKKGPGGEAIFSFAPPRKDIQYISGRDGSGGPYYFYAHLRPRLSEEEAAPFANHAVFLLDTSLSEEPDRFNTSVKLLQKILQSDATIEYFQVLLFDIGARWLIRPTGFWLANTEQGRREFLSRLDTVMLEGATDLSAALEKLSTENALGGKRVNIFLLSDGQVNWGRTEANQVVARFENQAKFPYTFFCYRTGLSAENLELFSMLTRRGGSIFNCFSEDMVKKVATAHRRQCLQVTGVIAAGDAKVGELLVAGRKGALYPGGELIVAGRCAKPGDIELELAGMYKGREVRFSFPLTVDDKSELVPRAWGEIAVASLVALNNPELEELITAYCQHFSIGSKVASFLILETEQDYKRFNISDELGEIKVEDIAGFLELQWLDAGKEISSEEAFRRFVEQIEKRIKLISGQSGEYVKKLLAAFSADDYELPGAVCSDKVVLKTEAPKSYLKARKERRREVGVYTEEAKRRWRKKAAEALRALSCVVELYPGRADALRLVGYRLLEMGKPASAAGLFWRVQESRPFEPQAYRDLARAFELAGKPGLAAVQYEILLAGKWHNRFRSLKQVVLEEYCLLMRTAIRGKSINKPLSDLFAARLAALAKAEAKADLRVTISWNTDNTDIDLWVIEPDGEKCYYEHKVTRNGGKLLDDLTQGYGPERYQIAKAKKGLYIVKVHYFGTNRNLLGGETYVTVTVTKHAGTDKQEVRRYNVVLKKSKQAEEVCRIEF